MPQELSELILDAIKEFAPETLDRVGKKDVEAWLVKRMKPTFQFTESAYAGLFGDKTEVKAQDLHSLRCDDAGNKEK